MNRLIILIGAFILFCLLSLFVGWMCGWNFERTPASGAWSGFTIIIAVAFALIADAFTQD